MEGWEDDGKRLKNTLPLYGNKDSMNLNSMILTNIVSSAYFKEELIQFKTFHEVVDEIYYKVEHMEPWEKNSRKLSGQVGMCAGVRGVAAGGIVSTAFCLLFKLFTLKLTRKQVNVMLNHPDSPYIRAIGFLYIRYSQPPADFWGWFSPFLEDEEEINLKAGGGYNVTIGVMCRMMLSSLDWFGTLFPRLPVHVQKDLTRKLDAIPAPTRAVREPVNEEPEEKNGHDDGSRDQWGEAARRARAEGGSRSPRRPKERRDRSPERRSGDRQRSRSRDRKRNRSTSRDRKNRSRSRERRRSRSRDRHRHRSNSRERRRSRSHDRRKRRSHSNDRNSRRRSRSHEKRGRSRSREKRSRSRDRRRR